MMSIGFFESHPDTISLRKKAKLGLLPQSLLVHEIVELAFPETGAASSNEKRHIYSGRNKLYAEIEAALVSGELKPADPPRTLESLPPSIRNDWVMNEQPKGKKLPFNPTPAIRYWTTEDGIPGETHYPKADYNVRIGHEVFREWLKQKGWWPWSSGDLGRWWPEEVSDRVPSLAIKPGKRTEGQQNKKAVIDAARSVDPNGLMTWRELFSHAGVAPLIKKAGMSWHTFINECSADKQPRTHSKGGRPPKIKNPGN